MKAQSTAARVKFSSRAALPAGENTQFSCAVAVGARSFIVAGIPFMKLALLPVVGSLLAALACATPARAQTPAASPSPVVSPSAAPAASPAEPVKDVRVVVHTDKGDIEATIFATKVPITAANFLNLAQQKFYDGLKFHRIISGFMTQGGDPSGNGTGGPGYQFEDEPNGDRKFDKPGIFAMANKGTNSNGSQFFITHGPAAHLNDGGSFGHYTIFGQVTKGQDVVTSLVQGEQIKSIDILDSTAPLFAKEAKYIGEWNTELKAKH